jgi:hypothetical protein
MALLAAVVSAGGCGARFYSPPSGPGVAATDAPAAIAEATRHCRSVQTFQAVMRLSGRRLPNLNVLTGVTSTGQLLLQVGATAAPDLWLAGSRDDAALLLRDGNRIVRAPAGDIVAALVGVEIGPEQFLALLTGCIARDLTVTGAIAHNGTRHITTPGAELFLEQVDGVWQVVAGSSDGVRVDYRPVTSSFPARARVRGSLGGREVSFTLDVQESLPDRPIDAGSFQLKVPPEAIPMTLDELRRMFAGR